MTSVAVCASDLRFVPYRFTGKERDTGTGLGYFGARYNASTMGRFMSPDPLMMNALRVINPQRLNLYSYAVNNPLNYIDPDGRDAVVVGFSKLAAGAGHVGLISVDTNGIARFGEFGPAGGSKPVWAGHVNSYTLATHVQFNGLGQPTQESLAALVKELSGTEQQPEESISLAYFKTSSSEQAALDAWMSSNADTHGLAWQVYFVGIFDCRDYVNFGLDAAGIQRSNLSQTNITPNYMVRLLMESAKSIPYSGDQKKKKQTEKVTTSICDTNSENCTNTKRD